MPALPIEGSLQMSPGSGERFNVKDILCRLSVATLVGSLEGMREEEHNRAPRNRTPARRQRRNHAAKREPPMSRQPHPPHREEDESTSRRACL